MEHKVVSIFIGRCANIPTMVDDQDGIVYTNKKIDIENQISIGVMRLLSL